MKKIKEFFFKHNVSLSALIGMFLIGLLLYSRFLNIKTARETVISTNLNILYIILYVLLFSTVLFSTILLIYKLITINKEKTPSKIFVLFAKLSNFISRLFEATYKMLFPRAPNNRFYQKFYQTMFGYCEKLDGYFSSRYTQDNNYFNDMALFLMCIKILPSLIIAITLCLDVFYFGVIKYFYKSLVLMLIPLGWICFVYILRDADKFNMETYREFFHSITVDFKNVDGKLHMEPTYTLKKELSETDEKTLVLEVCLYYRRELFLTTFDDLEYKRKKIYFILARLLINILFLSAWGYLVYYGLVLIVPIVPFN